MTAVLSPGLLNPEIMSKKSFAKNKELNLKELKKKKLELKSFPTSLFAVLTDKCNLNCIMCSRVLGENIIIPFEVIKKTVEIFPFLEEIEWQGGEVFLVKYFKKLYQIAAEYPNITQKITTNGLLLDESWARLLCDSKVSLNFSIDAVTKNTYEEIRKGAEFEKLTENLDIINKYNSGKINTSLNCVIMEQNFRELNLFPKFLKRYQINSVSFNIVKEDRFPAVYAFCDRKKALNYIRNIIPAIKQECQEYKICCEFNLDFFRGSCIAPWTKLMVENNGEVFPECHCNHKYSIGSLHNSSVYEIWNSEEAKKYRQLIKNKDFSNCPLTCIFNPESV